MIDTDLKLWGKLYIFFWTEHGGESINLNNIYLTDHQTSHLTQLQKTLLNCELQLKGSCFPDEHQLNIEVIKIHKSMISWLWVYTRCCNNIALLIYWISSLVSIHISVWNRHIFVGDSIRVPSCKHSVGSEIFVFLSKFYTPLPVPLSRPITSLELWPIRPFPSPDFIEDGSIRISSANLNSTWLIVFYPPNPSLVGIILTFNIRRFQAAQNGIILGFQN